MGVAAVALNARRSFVTGILRSLATMVITLVSLSVTALPTLVDNSTSTHFPPIGNRGVQPSSNAWAVCYYYATYTHAKDEGLVASGGDPDVLCSPAFLYNTTGSTRWSEEYTFPYLRKLTVTGCSSLASMPWNAGDSSSWPSTAAWMEALNRKTTDYIYLGDNYTPVLAESHLTTIKQRLADGDLAVTSSRLPNAFVSNYPSDQSGITNNGVLFGDANLIHSGIESFTIVGYDDNKSYFDGTQNRTGAFLLATSRGTAFGVSNTAGGLDKGFIWVSYDFFRNADYYFGYAAWTTDRPQYRPRAYVMATISSPDRNNTMLSGGIGFLSDAGSGIPSSVAWQQSDPIQLGAEGGPGSIPATQIPVDLTDGIPFISNPGSVQMFLYFAGHNGTLTDAVFHHDFDGDGVYQTVPSNMTPKPCAPGYYVTSNITFVADELTVTPAALFDAAGPAGGPFTPASQDYLLTNSNDNAVSVTVSKTAAWLDLSTTSVVLGAGGDVTVTASLNTTATTLAPGTYTDTIIFHNNDVGLSFNRAVRLVVRPATKLQWNPISSPQLVNQPISSTLRAVDSTGATVTQINGNVPITPTFSVSIGTGTQTWPFPLYNYYEDARTQFILHASEVGSAGTINSISMDLTRAPNIPLNNYTIRMKHTSLADYTGGASWEGSGWTVVHQSNQTITQIGWTPFAFTTPFAYNGVDNLMVDISFNNTQYTSITGLTRYTNVPTVRSMLGYSDSNDGDPLTWSGTDSNWEVSSRIPNVVIGFAGSAALSPTSVSLSNGVWTGDLFLDNVVPNVAISAEHTSTGLKGLSNGFAVDDVVAVEPRTFFNTNGPAGGPFTPLNRDYGLTNLSGDPVTVDITTPATWIQISSSNVTIPAGGTTTITVTINSAADSLAPGSYLEDITFTNQSNGMQQKRAVGITVRPAVALALDAIASPQLADESIPYTIRAVDTLGQTVRQVAGTADLTLDQTATTGDGTETVGGPTYLTADAARRQIIYLANEIGTSGTINSLALNIGELPLITINNFTIRIRPTSKADYAGGSTWESTGWTVVYQANTTISQTGWVAFNFTTPYYYDGTTNLMLDFSFNNPSHNYRGWEMGTYVGTPRMAVGTSDNGFYGNPLTWTGTTALNSTYYTVPNVRFNFSRNVSVTPGQTSTFVNGEWSGNLELHGAAPQLALQAVHSNGIQGMSNRFNLVEGTTLTQVVSSPNQFLHFDFNLGRIVDINLQNANPGGTLTVTRISPLATPPAEFKRPGLLINEYLEIHADNLGTGYTADIDWGFDPASAERLQGAPVNTVWRFDDGTSTGRYTVTAQGTTISLLGITNFSEWYAGNDFADDSTSPSVNQVQVQGNTTIDVTFSEGMGAGVLTAANYVVSGSGKGTLATNPSSVTHISGNIYRLTWASGKMYAGGDITITVTNAQDLAANSMGDPNSATHTGGAVAAAPTVSFSSAAPASTNIAISVTATLSDASTNFTAADLLLTNCTVSGFAGSGAVYTFTLTPSAEGTFSANVAAGQFTDAAGNLNNASAIFSRNYDITAPTIVLASTATDPTRFTPIPVTASLSEPTTNFTAADLSVTGATVSGFSGSGSSYAFNLVPSGQGAVTVKANASVFTDSAANANLESNLLSRTYDTVAPGITLSTSAPSPTNATAAIVVTLTEASSDFTAADITVTNATVANFTGSGASYTFDLVPGVNGTFTASVSAGTFTDAATNANTVSNTISRTYDGTPPTAGLGCTDPDPTRVSLITINVLMSESTTNFTISDIVTTNATVNSISGSGSFYIFRLLPAGQGLVSARIPAGAFTDAAGNGNLDSGVISRTWDTISPGITLSTTAPAVTNVSPIPFTATLTESSTNFTAADVSASNATVANFAGSGASYTFDIVPSAQGSIGVSVAASAFTDAAANNSLAATTVFRTYDSIAPSVTAVSVQTGLTVNITFNEAMGSGVTTAANYVVTGTGKGTLAASPTSIALVSGNTYRLTWSSGEMLGGGNITITASNVPDVAGNIVGAGNAATHTGGAIGVKPSATLSSIAPQPTNTSPIPVTVTLTESATDFTDTDLSLTNATVTNFSGSGTSYAFNLVPGSQGSVSVSIPAGAIADAAGNTNNASAVLSRTYDSVAPGATLSSTATEPTRFTPIPVTVVLTEASTNFTTADITPVNGTVSGFAGSGTSYSFNLTPSGQGQVTASIAAGTFTDSANNTNGLSNTLLRTYDTVAPTITLSTAAPNPFNSAIPVTVVLSEISTNFTSADITPTNASVTNFAGSGSSYSFDLVPSAQGSVSVSVAASTFTDAAGNNNTVSNTLNRTHDSIAPTVNIASPMPNPTNIALLVVTATLTESSTTFAAADILTTNGVVSNFSGSGVNYTFNVTASGQGIVEVAVPAAAFTDAAGNPNPASSVLNRTYDSVAPSATLSTTAPAVTNTSPIPVTVVLSESSTNFIVSDIAVSNATVTGFTGSGTNYAFNLVPSSQGSVGAIVLANRFTDAAGNNNTVSNNLTRTYDNIPPTVTLASIAPAVTNVAPIPVTVTLSQAATDFGSADLSVTNGTVSDFSGSGTGYSFNITPAGQGAVAASVAAGTFTDSAGNGNTASTVLSRTYDTVPPTVTLATSAVDPTNVSPIPVTVTLSETSTNFTAPDVSATNATVSGFTGSGSAYTLNVVPSASGTVTVTVAAGVFTDAAGNSNDPSNVVVRVYDGGAPASAATTADNTLAGTSTIPVSFTASDVHTGVQSTVLFVKVPASGVYVDSGLSPISGTGGTFNYTAATSGVYHFYTVATDNASNIESAPGTPDISVAVNLVANSSFTHTVTASSQVLVFPMTSELNVTVSLVNATIGGTVTVSRTTPLAAPPAYFQHPEKLLNESLTINGAGLGGFTAELSWEFDLANTGGMDGSPIGTVYKFDGGPDPVATYAVTPAGNVLTIPGITSFSTWYAGNSIAVPVALSTFTIE